MTEAGGFFGEMSLLTGEPRAATVTAMSDTVVLEIPADAFRQILLAEPTVVEQIGLVMEARRAGLARTRTMALGPLVTAEPRETFLTRVQRFLHLPGA